jgi:hypothetical protein
MDFNPTRVVEVETECSRRVKAIRAANILHANIRIDDIRAAIELGGSCLALLLLIHFRRDVLGQEKVTLPSSFLAEFGIDRSAKRRGLECLDRAKLINVKRAIGHTAVVELRAKRRKTKGEYEFEKPSALFF